jgi:tetrahydromethanopterin S-methyltransferase subunit D
MAHHHHPNIEEAERRVKEAGSFAATELASTASAVDPMPHYIMSGACGAASYFAYSRLANPQAAGLAAVFGVGYYAAGYFINSNQTRLGYDIASGKF